MGCTGSIESRDVLDWGADAAPRGGADFFPLRGPHAVHYWDPDAIP